MPMSKIDTKDHCLQEHVSTEKNAVDTEDSHPLGSTIEVKAITPHMDGSLKLHTTGSQVKLRTLIHAMSMGSKRRLLLVILSLILIDQFTHFDLQQASQLWAYLL